MAIKQTSIRLDSKAFVQSGFYIMRHQNLYMIIDCLSANQQAPSAHKHNGRLSFELYAYDKTFIVDPGTYLYTANPYWRNRFRSSVFHNTLVVDKKEQNKFFFPFIFLDKAIVKVNKWIVKEDHDFLEAEHNGYKPVIHQRRIYFDKKEGYWMIKDILTGRGEHNFDLYFHFAPFEVIIDSKDPLTVKTRVSGANIVVIPLETEGLSLSLEEGWVSSCYGIKEKAKVLKYSKRDKIQTSFTTLLYPFNSSLPSLEKLRNSLAVNYLYQEK